jgi:hypothetical protein
MFGLIFRRIYIGGGVWGYGIYSTNKVLVMKILIVNMNEIQAI